MFRGPTEKNTVLSFFSLFRAQIQKLQKQLIFPLPQSPFLPSVPHPPYIFFLFLFFFPRGEKPLERSPLNRRIREQHTMNDEHNVAPHWDSYPVTGSSPLPCPRPWQPPSAFCSGRVWMPPVDGTMQVGVLL